MARSDEAQWFFNAVYEAVQRIPQGRVTSYGHIALLLGRPECPRQVGVCLKHLPPYADHGEHFFHDHNVPWQRVINAKGIISPRGPGGASRQAAALRREGVTVGSGSLGELMVDLSSFGWFPIRLPGDDSDINSRHSSAGELDD